MEALKFDAVLHYEEVSQWAKDRHLSPPPFAGLPKNGRIVPGRCALFLYLTDSSTGFIESLIANPDPHLSDLPEAIDLCALELEKDARAAGVRYLIAHSFLPAVFDHAFRSGFRVHPESYRLLSKEISG